MNKGIIKKHGPVVEYIKQHWKEMTDKEIAFQFDMKVRAVKRLRSILGYKRDLENCLDLTVKVVKRIRTPAEIFEREERRRRRAESEGKKGPGRRRRTEEELAALMFR